MQDCDENSSAAQPNVGRYTTWSLATSCWTTRHSELSTAPISTSTLSFWISWVAIWLAWVGSLCGSTYVTWSGWPLMPPAALTCCTARSVPRCMPAAIGALVPLASAM